VNGVLRLTLKSFAICLLFCSSLWAAEPHRVLFISAYHPAFPTFCPQVEGIKSAFDEKPILLDIEFMDTKRFPGRETFETFHRALTAKLSRIRPYDAIIVGDDNALSFVLEHQGELFPEEPIVFLGVNNVDLALEQNANPFITGVVETVSMKETLEVMLKLHPDARRVVALVDDLPSGQGDLKTFFLYREEFALVDFSELSLSELSFESFAKKLQALGNRDIVLLLSAYRDKNGKTLLFRDSLELIKKNLSRPLYHLWFHGMGQGVLGGKLISHRQQGKTAAEMVLEILEGRPVGNISVSHESPNRYIFDFKEMARFGIEYSSLPSDSQIYNEPQSFYRQHKGVIWMVVGIFFGYTLLLLGMWLTIQRRKRAEEALHASENRYRAIVEDQTELICRNLPDFTITFVNEAYCRYFNKRRDELIGKSFLTRISGTDRATVEDYFATLNKNNPVASHEHSVTMPKGEEHWHLWTNRAIFDEAGEVVEFQGVGRDITEEKRAEEALQKALTKAEEARTKIEAILQSVADGLIFTDMDNRIILMSASAETILDRKSSEVFLSSMEEAIADKNFREQISAIQGDVKKEAVMELELPAGNQEPGRVIQAKSSLVRGPDGSKSGVITLLHDVSRERELDRIKSEFISTAAHELRTPLTSIRGYSQFLLAEKGLDNEQQMEFLTIINEKTMVLEKIINDLLDLNRIESGRVIHVEKDWCDLGSVLAELVGQYRKEYQTHRFETILPENPVELLVDKGKIVQVMENLLINAVKFSHAGSLIQVSCEMPVNEVRISVKDEGIGMTPAQVERVFDKFYRADSSLTAKEGLGLGMAIVKNIIEAHSGKIWVKSEPGQGTTVSFSLPRSQGIDNHH
jgi:PAS domain S-box-containing protein